MVAQSEGLASRVKRELLTNAVPAVPIVVTAALPFLPFLLLADGGQPAFASHASFFVAAGCVLVALLSRWLYYAFALVFVPLSVLAIHLVQRFGSTEGWRLDQPDARVETYFESPTSETLEYFHAHWWLSDTFVLMAGIVYLVFLTWVFVSSPGLSRMAKAFVAILLSAWIAVALWVRAWDRLEQWPQYQLAYAAFEARSRFERLADRQETLDSRARPTGHCASRYRKVVIVLGESVATGHMSAFGYARPTTPFVTRSSPYLFDALSPANQTRIALPVMLSPVVAENYDAFYDTPSLVSLLGDCGYRTLWVSNQGRIGRHDSFVSSIAKEADREVFLNELSYKEVHLDGALVDELEKLGAFEATGQATFIHLIGSHADYRKRFPRGFGLPLRGVVGDYDNSILYTDTVLERLHRRFGAEGVLFIYVADHGEVVSEKKFGHGFTPGYREEYRTPLMVWTEDRGAMAELNSRLDGARLNLESFNDIVAYLVGADDALRVSTRSQVSNLAAGNVVAYEALRAFSPEPAPGSKAGK